VAVLNNELFVLCERSDNQINVYSTINFTLLRHLSVDSQYPVNCIAACPQKRVIYVINENECGVHRLGLDGSECMWPLTSSPLSLSVTRTSHILVLCGVTLDDNTERNKVLFLSSEDGECVRSITAQISGDFTPWHCVHLKDDQYLMAYGGHEQGYHGGISLFDGDGKVLRSTDEELPMRYPSFVAVDSDQFLLVCLLKAGFLLLFDPMLDYVGLFADGIGVEPQSLVLDELTRRLYMQESRSVSIVQL